MRTIRRGFGVIEVLVVVLILAVLVALMLPAVQEAREGARRAQCRNNLRQLGLSLHSYHETAKTLPPGWISSNQFGWSTLLLPFFDERRLYNKLNFGDTWAADSKSPLVVLPMLRCPSDTGANTVGSPVLSTPAGRANFPGVSGATLISTEPVDINLTHGTFGEDSTRQLKRDFTDGLANPFWVGERKSSNGPLLNPGGDTIWVGVRDNETQQGQSLAVGDCDSTNRLNFKGFSATAKAAGNISGFSSYHVGGAHFLLGDGSVRFVSQDINPITYANLATIDDGAKLADF